MGISGERKSGLGQADAFKDGAGACFGIRPVGAGVPANAFGHLLADGLDRVKRGHGLLKDHAEIVAAQPAHGLLGGCQNVDPVEDDMALCPCKLRQELHDGEGGHRFAGSGFADKAKNLAGLDFEVDVLQNRIAGDGERQIFDLEKAHRSRLSRGSRRSRRPSPRRLSPSTVMTMARPGKMARCGAIIMRVCASNSMRPQEGMGGCAPRPR